MPLSKRNEDIIVKSSVIGILLICGSFVLSQIYFVPKQLRGGVYLKLRNMEIKMNNQSRYISSIEKRTNLLSEVEEMRAR